MTQTRWSQAVLAAGAGGLVVAALLAPSGADATQGQPVIAGQLNTASFRTTIENRVGGAGLRVVGRGTGIEADAPYTDGIGVSGVGNLMGVAGGSLADGGTGVYGDNEFSTGIGVHGRTTGVGSGVYGEATSDGVGVNGLSESGSGVRARSDTGIALEVIGPASFSRSGTAVVAAGTSSRVVPVAGLTASSMVLATAQQAKSVFVGAAVPAAGKLTIQLTGNAPAGGLRVAYFVID